MNIKQVQLSEELNRIMGKAEDRSKALNLAEIPLETVQYLLIETYLSNSELEESSLSELFMEAKKEKSSEVILSVCRNFMIDAEKQTPRTTLSDSNVDFDKKIERIIERANKTAEITRAAVGDDDICTEIRTATFFVAMFLEESTINDYLQAINATSLRLLEIKEHELSETSGISGILDILKKGASSMPGPESKKPKDDSDEDAKFENAGKRDAISTRKPKVDSTTPTIDEFGVDMTEKAEKGEYDPVIGRDKEISQIIEILSCRKKCNAILLGEAGTGKSALVEGLAQKIAAGDVPRELKNRKIVSISTTDLTAGTQYRGQLEERVMNLCNELRDHREFIIFLDEFHSATSENSTSIADMLKPSLSRGEITVIASTTIQEYKKYIESDGALKRRFQKVMISEPNVDETYKILKGLAKKYQEFHHVRYSDAVLKACAEYSERYMYDRKSPDRAIDIMDTAGALTKLANPSNTDELDRLEKVKKEATEKKIKAIDRSDFSEAKAQRDEENRLEAEIAALKKKEAKSSPKTWPEVTIENVASVISKISGVSVDKIVTPEMEKIRNMGGELSKSVIGQDEAINSVVKSLSKSFLGLRDEEKPIASFLFVGPTGVGKTLLAKKIAEEVFGSEKKLLRIDGGELSQEHMVTKLIGATASYVGYNDSPLLDQAREISSGVLLVDEFEKIHEKITSSIFLNILDTGMIKMSNGVEVSFKNFIILFTSNEGTKDLELKGNGIGFGEKTAGEKRSMEVSTVMKAVEKRFRPETRGRLSGIIVFNELNKENMSKIFELELDKFKTRLKSRGYTLKVGKALKEKIVNEAVSKYGARGLSKEIGKNIEDKVVEAFLDSGIDIGKKKIKADLVSDKVEITFE